MNVITPSYSILTITAGALQLLEECGRVCYKSEDKITADSAGPFVKKIARTLKHESVIEHASATVKFTVDRGVSHELVRHRLASYSQESTRYCDYGKRGVTFIKPLWVSNQVLGERVSEATVSALSDADSAWVFAMLTAERQYNKLRGLNWSPQQARSVLPNSLKTEIVMTANFRQWKHTFSMRCAENAHPQMREVMIPLANEFAQKFPEIFDEY